MPSRIDTLTYAGFGLLGAGTTGELVKDAVNHACPPLPVKSENIMELNLFFGYLPGYELNLTGVIAMLGAGMMLLSIYRGSKEKKRRIERESFPNPIVKNPDDRSPGL